MDPRRTPEKVLAGHPYDQMAEFTRNLLVARPEIFLVGQVAYADYSDRRCDPINSLSAVNQSIQSLPWTPPRAKNSS